MAANDMVIKIIGEFTDKISPELSKLTTQNIPALMGALAGLVAVKVAEYMAEMVSKAIDVGDALNDMSERTGVASETLSGLAVAAKLGDVSMGEMAAGLKKLSANLADSQDATSKQAVMFKKLGIETKDANGNIRKVDEVMGDLADKFSKSSNDANKVKIAMDTMGKAGTQLITVLNGGRDALDAYKKLGDDMGLGWTTEQTAQAGKYNDAMDTLSMAFDGFWQIIAKYLLPKLVILAEYLADSAKEGGLLRNVLDGLAALIAGPVGAAFDFLATIGSTISLAFTIAGRAIGGVAAGLVALLSGDLQTAKGIMAEMDRDIKKQYDDYIAFNTKVWSPPEAAKPDAPKPTIGDDGEAAHKQAEKYTKALAALQKELYGVSKAGKEIDTTWQTIHGDFKDFTETQKKSLISKAAEIDITKQLLDLETARIKTQTDRFKKSEQQWVIAGSMDHSDKIEREGWLAAENQRIDKMAEFAAKEVEISKLGPVAKAAAMKQLEADRKKYNTGGEEYNAEKWAGEDRAQTIVKGQIWNDTLVKNSDAYHRLSEEVKQYGVMLKVGSITQEKYNELMYNNKRAVEDLNASQTRASRAYADVVLVQARAVEDLKIKEDAINKAYADGNISLAEKTMRLHEVKSQMDNMNPVYAIDQVEKLQNTIKSASASFEGMFSDYIFNAMEGKWLNLGDMIRKQISSMIAQMIAAKIQMALFGDFGSTPAGKTPSSTGYLGAAFSSLFGGFREGGGDVAAGKAYVVGEKRPEIFVPKTSGTIIPNIGANSNQQNTNINMTVNAMDSQSMINNMSSIKRELAAMINHTNKSYNIR